MHVLMSSIIRVVAADPGVSPNSNGVPGIGTAKEIVGGLLTFGLIASVGGLVISAATWALASHGGNYSGTHRGKQGVLVCLGAALLIGGADILVRFFSDMGSSLF